MTREPGYTALQNIPGIGPTLAAVFVAEIGDINRFASAPKLTCWAGLTPKHHQSNTHVHRGSITKRGSRLVRWAAIESVKTITADSQVGVLRERVADRRDRNIGAVAAARRLGVRLLRAARRTHARPRTSVEGGMNTAFGISLVGAGRWVMTPTWRGRAASD